MTLTIRSVLLFSSVLVFSGCPARKNAFSHLSYGEDFHHAAINPQVHLEPGMVVARWKSGELVPVCSPNIDYELVAADRIKKTGPIEIKDKSADSLKASLGGNVKKIVEANLGGKRVKNVTVKLFRWTIDHSDYLKDMRRAEESERCRNEIAYFLDRYKETKYLSYVYRVAEVDMEYEVEVEGGAEVDAKLAETLAKQIGVNAVATFEADSKSTFTVKGAKLYPLYNLEDRVKFTRAAQ